MKLINWNIQRKKPASWQASSLLAQIGSLDPDIVCLTEAHAASMQSIAGYVCSVRGVEWADESATERKVLLWSKAPWKWVVKPPALNKTGGAIAGITRVASEQVLCVGLCAPYHAASPKGVAPKRRQWSDQLQFWRCLAPFLKTMQRTRLPVVIAGDFNQFVPHSWGSKLAFQEMMRAMRGVDVVTAGLIGSDGKAPVCHIASSHHFIDHNVASLPRRNARGPRSDHDGALLIVERIRRMASSSD